MGRKAQVSKEQLLAAGLQIILREGQDGLSVKSVAAEVGTSTTPVTWTFSSFENYRRELRSYIWDDIKGKAAGIQQTDRSYRRTGIAYVDMAIDQPNLLRYLRSGEEYFQASGGMGLLFDAELSKITKLGCAAALGVSEAQAEGFMQFVNTYAEGLVSLILSGVIHPTKAEAHKKIREAGIAYTILLKASEGKSQG